MQFPNRISSDARPAHRAPALDEIGPIVLTQAELEQVAVAGSKLGVSSGSGVKF